MLSFSKIITVAAVAFGTLSQAVPLSARDASIETRDGDSGLIKGVLTKVLTDVTVELAPIYHLVPSNATLVNVSPILNSVYRIISGAVDAVDELVDKPVGVVVGVVTVEDVQELVCNILTVVFGALAVVLDLVKETGILEILIGIVHIIFIFVKVVITVTGGFGGALLFYLQGYVVVASGPVAGVLSILKISSPL
ncbi:hypothetical protein EDB89DRAFT_1933732 [Lactarius sanguifluus]|nr:hypothetical protein EDB89DRAFT_1933732 [Lactarius sanguifluus]